MRHSAGQFCVGIVVALALTTLAVAQAETIKLIEDFNDYPLNETIHDKGDWEMWEEPMWQAQRNSSALGDHGHSLVVQKGDKVALELINRDTGGELDTVYTAMNLGINNYIEDTGTIYIRFMANQDGDTLVAVNNYQPGWDYDAWETGDAGAPSFQGTATGEGAGYAHNAMLVELSAEDWRCYNISGYEQHAPAKTAETVYEMWMQFDLAAQAARFYLCEDGGDPAVVLTSAQGEWWGFRDSQDSVENLKFFAGNHDYETQVYVESIAVNTTEYVTVRPDGWEAWTLSEEPVCNPGDADGDGDVDLDDFAILKVNFGTSEGADCSMGDFDGDGDVDLDDFALLKTNFGTTF